MKLENKTLNKKDYKPLNKNKLSNKKFNLKSVIIIIGIICIFILLLFIRNNNKNNITTNRQFILSKKTDKSNQIDVEFFNELKKILKEDIIKENEMMDSHTTFKIGGPAKYFIKPRSVDQIIEIINLCNKHKVNYFILGNGSNLLVSDEGYYGVVINIHENNFSSIEVKKEDEKNYLVKVGGGILMKTLAIELCLLSLTGLEDIIDIPGTVGGGIIMNASFHSNALIKHLLKVKVITPEGILKELNKDECGFILRGSLLKDKKYLVVEATFKLKMGNKIVIQKTMTDNTKNRYEKQPMYFGSAGCFFVWNHGKHGSMYEKYKENNLVSYQVGNAMIYTYNIAFIVNLGKAKASDVMAIVTHIEKVMKEKYKIEMRREVVTIGSFNGINYY